MADLRHTAVVALLLPAGIRAGWGLSSRIGRHGVFGALRIYGGCGSSTAALYFGWSSFETGVTAALLVNRCSRFDGGCVTDCVASSARDGISADFAPHEPAVHGAHSAHTPPHPWVQ